MVKSGRSGLELDYPHRSRGSTLHAHYDIQTWFTHFSTVSLLWIYYYIIY
jgi:hypothetical protein